MLTACPSSKGRRLTTLRLPHTSAGAGQGLLPVPGISNYSLVNTLLFIEEQLLASVSYNYIVNGEQ